MVSVFLALVLGTSKQASTTLEFDAKNQQFVVSEAGVATKIPLNPKKTAPTEVVYRLGDKFAVWDKRGLTIRVGKKLRSTRLPDVALTPKLFEREVIIQTRDLIESGVRTREAANLSGSCLIDEQAFFLIRWEEKSGKPWLEALIKVDLAAEAPIAELVGKFQGLSINTEPFGDALWPLGTELKVLIQNEAGWGVGTYDVANKAFLPGTVWPGKLKSADRPGGRFVAFIEETSYGTKSAGRVDLVEAKRKAFVESKGELSIASATDPILVISKNSEGRFLHNLQSGAVLPLSSESGVAKSDRGVLIWSPNPKPTSAALMAPVRWTKLATWSLKPPAPQVDVSARTRNQQKPPEQP